jgi:hypothetical protein
VSTLKVERLEEGDRRTGNDNVATETGTGEEKKAPSPPSSGSGSQSQRQLLRFTPTEVLLPPSINNNSDMDDRHGYKL